MTEHTNTTKQTAATTQQPLSLTPLPPKFDLVALKNETQQSLTEDLQKIVTKEIKPIQKQIELLCTEFKASIDNLASRIDDLAEIMKLFAAQSQITNNSLQSTPPNTAKGNGK